MTANERHDRTYAKLMGRDVGWAIYNKTRSVDLRPGGMGFFDTDGEWVPIINLIDDNLEWRGWGRLPGLLTRTRDEQWAT